MILTIEELEYFSKNRDGWNNGLIEPTPRLPIMAICSIGDFDDGMDINDDELQDSIIEDNGCQVPICGVSYNGGSGTVITPYCVRASDASELTFISWRRVMRWRYLSNVEATSQWEALKNEVLNHDEK